MNMIIYIKYQDPSNPLILAPPNQFRSNINILESTEGEETGLHRGERITDTDLVLSFLDQLAGVAPLHNLLHTVQDGSGYTTGVHLKIFCCHNY